MRDICNRKQHNFEVLMVFQNFCSFYEHGSKKRNVKKKPKRIKQFLSYVNNTVFFKQIQHAFPFFLLWYSKTNFLLTTFQATHQNHQFWYPLLTKISWVAHCQPAKTFHIKNLQSHSIPKSLVPKSNHPNLFGNAQSLYGAGLRIATSLKYSTLKLSCQHSKSLVRNVQCRCTCK